MKIFFTKILVVSVLILGLSACGASKDAADAYQGESPKTILKYGQEALQDKSYTEAVKRFEALDIQYPFALETEKAQLFLIYAYYMKDEYPLSVAAADRFIRLHPANPHVDYAYFMRGLASYYQNLGFLERVFSLDLAKRDLGQIKLSYAAFDDLTKRYPHSYYTPTAQQYKVYLRNILARHEFEVAEYYYKRKAYIAAVNRASIVVKHYQGAPAVLDALKLMTRSYEKLGMQEQAQKVQRVLQYNA